MDTTPSASPDMSDGENVLKLAYQEGIEPSYFAEFEHELQQSGNSVKFETLPGGPSAGAEFWLFPAILIFLGKPFIDEFLKRAAVDANDVVYPKFKGALAKLLKKVFKKERCISILASSPGKVQFPTVLVFAFYSETRTGTKLKFVFLETLTDQEYDEAVDGLLNILGAHYRVEADDVLADTVPPGSWKPILLAYDRETKLWKLYDPNSKPPDGNRAP
jgi:hypothetical protein